MQKSIKVAIGAAGGLIVAIGVVAVTASDAGGANGGRGHHLIRRCRAPG